MQERSLMRRILVIEDESVVRDNILEILDADDFEAIGAENGRIGVELAKEYIPDLILCDIMMPELDGYGVLDALKKDPKTATIPFIFLTAKADKADLRQGMNLGADDYLTKPFRRQELLKAIAARLEKQTAVVHRYNTELKQIEERLNYLINYDNLTNLPNQQLLRARLQQLMLQANRQQQTLAVLSLDIDRFSRINETLGHTIGNQLLKAVAHRLRSCLGSTHTIARFNSDQFVIILSPSTSPDASRIAKILLDVLAEPFLLQGQEIFLTASIGIALYPNDSKDIDNLLQHADAALFHARQQGGHQYQFYKPEMKGYLSRLLAIEAGLHYALERSELKVYYQPQIDLQTRRIVGAEALLRWQHPELGFVSPAEFIPIAEQNGSIMLIEEWVLQTVCSQLVTWNRAGMPPLRISVNLSGRQFYQPNFSQRVVRILQSTGIDPQFLELELTERIVIQNIEENRSNLKELKSLGLKLSIDDFGTGYSSLSYLKQFPFDTVKIDQCFVRNICEDAKNAAITSAIIQMAHNLNLRVIAEGVETKSELDFICDCMCDEMQGYLFSRPVGSEDFEAMVRADKRLSI
ncbi:MAG: EAL domain-containing protein [Oscillatoriaceae bacterium SKW80]|nr:EAL domain-containing protein [Oscillatoriaceae bacterium SKYG93]MCX8121711.1 EAL domain-containing protein [Oscillatoriaceae bacterium SKW80]MDW8453672.1 EAL domain-containing protein [Oscillatoriaceae cyanobacterium SKYGB_i_bin93]